MCFTTEERKGRTGGLGWVGAWRQKRKGSECYGNVLRLEGIAEMTMKP